MLQPSFRLGLGLEKWTRRESPAKRELDSAESLADGANKALDLLLVSSCGGELGADTQRIEARLAGPEDIFGVSAKSVGAMTPRSPSMHHRLESR
jgi:hypothetical protein